MGCPNCASHDLIQLNLAPSGRPVCFTTCRSCEHRWWATANETIDLDEVLGAVAAS